MPSRPLLRVVGGPLVRVLAVSQFGHLPKARDEAVGKRLTAEKPRRDRRLVGRGRRECLRGELASGLLRDVATRAELLQHPSVALGPTYGDDVCVVLGRAPQHRWAADVDHLDGVLLLDAVPTCDLREPIETDTDEVERDDPVLPQGGHVLGVVRPGEDGGMDPRVEGLHAPSEHFRDLRQVLDQRRLDAVFGELLGGPAARDQQDVELLEAARELDETGLVPDRQERAADQLMSSRTVFGNSRCSTACTRARSVSTVSPSSTGTRSETITGPVSIPSSTW